MITDFKAFSLPHIVGLVLPVLIGILFIILNLKSKEYSTKRMLNILFVIVLILVRGSRYIIDIFVGRFDIFDLFSLQICHIDLILLIVCLIKPNKYLFSFTFLVGIPMGLAVALMPGTVHPVPGLPRAILFISSHMLLVMGAVYIALVEKLVIKFKYVVLLLISGNISILLIYVINRILDTNFMYIMYAPKGTVIEKLYNVFSWPGYVLAMDLIAVSVILLCYGFYSLLHKKV